jgi:hypothetical protein
LLAIATPSFAEPVKYEAGRNDRVGFDSAWYVTGCQPDKTLTLFNYEFNVVETLGANGSVTYSISKLVGREKDGDLIPSENTIKLVKITGCTGTFWFH